MLFRQLFEPVSSTYTYLIGCESTRQAALIDPVIVTVERDLAELDRLGLTLTLTVETHIHADHITGALELQQATGSRIAGPGCNRLSCVDIEVEDGRPLRIGLLSLIPIFTPGHTDDHYAYQLGDRLFTGDALLIDGCGRTDFQNGDADTLYRSVTERLFTLPDDCLVYPGHDYQGRRVSTIAQEKGRNPRLGNNRSLEAFRAIMNNLNLPHPTFIDFAVPGNHACGICPDHLPEALRGYCEHAHYSPQG